MKAMNIYIGGVGGIYIVDVVVFYAGDWVGIYVCHWEGVYIGDRIGICIGDGEELYVGIGDGDVYILHTSHILKQTDWIDIWTQFPAYTPSPSPMYIPIQFSAVYQFLHWNII